MRCYPMKPQQSFNLIAISLLKWLRSSNTSAWICLERQKWTFSNNTDVGNIRLLSPGHEQPSSAHNPSGTPNLHQLLWTWSFWKHQLCRVNLLLQSSAKTRAWNCQQCLCYWCGQSGAFKVGFRWCNLHLTKKIKYVKLRLLQVMDSCIFCKTLLLIIAKPLVSAVRIVSTFDCTGLGSKEACGNF